MTGQEFGCIMEKIEGKMRGWCHNHTPLSHEEVKDFVQDAVIKAWLNRESIAPTEGDMMRWCIVAMRRAYIDMFRHLQKYPRISMDAHPDWDMAGHIGQPDRVIGKLDYERVKSRFFDNPNPFNRTGSPEQDRIWWACMELVDAGWSVSECAAHFGKTRSAVKAGTAMLRERVRRMEEVA